MHTEYPDGFTEALIRNLTDDCWDVATLDLKFDAWSPDVPDWLRVVCPSPHRITVAIRRDRGVLLLDELHVPLAAEIAWTLRKLRDLESLVRDRLPDEYRETSLLRSGIVLYADENFDMIPDEERLEVVRDEHRPEIPLDAMAARLLGDVDHCDEVDALADSMRQLGRWRSRSDCLSLYVAHEETVPTFRLAS